MTVDRYGFIGLVIAVGAVSGAGVGAQTPAPSVTTSFGVDTSITEVRDIVHLTRAYLAHPDTSARSKGLWSSSSLDLRFGDLAMEAYQGFPATIVGVTGTSLGDSVFVVKIIHGSADSAGTHLQPYALQRIYAVRAPGSPYGWQLSVPLPRVTRGWARKDIGRITYWYAPDVTPSPIKASRRSLPELYAALRQYQQSHPNVSLTEVLQGRAQSLDEGVALNATRGLIVDSIYRSSGIAGLKEFARTAGRDTELVKTLPKYIKGMDENPDKWWREETERANARR